MWYVTAWDEDADPQESVWTLSRDPREAGWNTDGGFRGYGLTKADAEELANAANEIERLRAALDEYACSCADDEKYWVGCNEQVCGRSAWLALQQKDTE
jgi:hypothetical protein